MDKLNEGNVYQLIARAQAALAKEGVGKDRVNQQQKFSFRGIDDVMNALAPVLSDVGLCILPCVLVRDVQERESKSGGTLFYVTVQTRYDFVSAHDGTKHEVVVFGEAMDSGDKATNKAMSAAYKYACLQTFCIPTEGDNDADSTTHDVAPRREVVASDAGGGSAVCPECGKAGTVLKSKFDGGGWFCFAKRGGCGAKFKTWPPEEDPDPTQPTTSETSPGTTPTNGDDALLSQEQERVIRELLDDSSGVFDGDPVKDKTLARLPTMTAAKASVAIDWLKEEIKKRKAAMEAQERDPEADGHLSADEDLPFDEHEGADDPALIPVSEMERLDGLRVVAKVRKNGFDDQAAIIEGGAGSGAEKAQLLEAWIHEQAAERGVNLAPKPKLTMA